MRVCPFAGKDLRRGDVDDFAFRHQVDQTVTWAHNNTLDLLMNGLQLLAYGLRTSAAYHCPDLRL